MNVIDYFILDNSPTIFGVLIILLAMVVTYALAIIVIEKIHDNFFK